MTMAYRRLAGSQLELSRLGFGCWAIGGQYWGDDVVDSDSIAAVHAALDAGINWFDTAPLYGLGHADRVLRKALATHPQGADAIIATKVGVRVGGAAGEHARSELTADHVRADCDASLTRLGVERIDLLQVHWPCELATPLEETFEALGRLVQAGKVRHIGVCNYSAHALREILTILPTVVALQTPYSLMRRRYEHELAAASGDLGLSVLAYEPLCRGLLTGKYQQLPSFPDTDMRRHDERFQVPRFLAARALVADLSRVAAKLSTTPAAVALAWALSGPNVTSVIAGCKRPEQLRDNVGAVSLSRHPKLKSVVDRVAAHHGPV